MPVRARRARLLRVGRAAWRRRDDRGPAATAAGRAHAGAVFSGSSSFFGRCALRADVACSCGGATGKTTILYKLKLGQGVSTIPTVRVQLARLAARVSLPLKNTIFVVMSLCCRRHVAVVRRRALSLARRSASTSKL